MTADERSELLDALLEGDISEGDFLRIEAELSVDAEVRQEYYRRLQLNLLLERVAAEGEPPSAMAAASKRVWSARRLSLLAGVLLGTAASLFCMAALDPWTDERRDGQPGEMLASVTEASASGFGILSGQANAVWATEPMSSGSLLPAGELHLKSGLVHLELFSGVQVMIQGESLFSINSPMQVTMHSGRARAHVPEPAIGFRIKTASGEVVDLGTEFTVDVDESGSSVQVIEGEVELRSKVVDGQRVPNGSALQWSQDGTISERASGPLDLIGPSEFRMQLASQQSEQFQRWQASAQRLRSDPRLIAYYQPDPDVQWSRNLVNLAASGGAIASEAAIVAAKRSEDRWGREKGALDFSRMGSRVRVAVPGEYRGLTLMCWVKINSLDRWYNSLFLTDGHEEREPHWQIMDDGRMFFSVKLPSRGFDNEKQTQHVFYSPSFWDSSLNGRWIMLCTTYDVEGKQVTHFLNGKPISVEVIRDEWLVESIRMGAASICNWSEPMYRTDPQFAVRNLNGSMDEFAMFAGALSSHEILELFRAGNPRE